MSLPTLFIRFWWDVRPRRKHIKSHLPARETEIAGRLIAARRVLGLDQSEAARKVGIPKSTLASYELCIAPLKVDLALRFCRNLIISEEWLATGRFTITERVGKSKGISDARGLEKIFIRQCMDLLSSPEATSLPKGALFSQAFDDQLSPVFAARIRANYYTVGIAADAWSGTNIELGYDINAVLIERFIWLLQNEAIGRNCSQQHAAATYLGFLMRMAIFGFKKCMEQPITADRLGLPNELFNTPDLPINAFVDKESVHADRQFAPLSTKRQRQAALK